MPAGGVNAGCRPPIAKREEGPIAPAHAQPHLAGDHESVDQARIEQHRIEERALLIEVDAAEDVHLQADEVELLPGQDGDELPHDQEPRAHAELEDQRQIDRDQRRRAPGHLHHRTEQVVIARHGEELPNHAQVLRRVANQILRRQHGAQRVGAHACLHRVFIDRAVDAQQSADAREHEAEADRNRLESVGRDDHEQGEAAAGNLGVQQAEGRQRGEAFDLEVQGARVLTECRGPGRGSRRRARLWRRCRDRWPVGGWKPKSRSKKPRLASGLAKSAVTAKPALSKLAVTGPSLTSAEMVAASVSLALPLSDRRRQPQRQELDAHRTERLADRRHAIQVRVVRRVPFASPRRPRQRRRREAPRAGQTVRRRRRRLPEDVALAALDEEPPLRRPARVRD